MRQAFFEKIINRHYGFAFCQTCLHLAGQFHLSTMRKHRRKLQFLWLLLCAVVGAVAGPARAAAVSGSPFIVDSWNNEQGLPQSSVISIIQTKDGYLWLGTLNGLVRFDGNHFTVFDENNTPGLNSDRIVCLFEDRRGELWVGTDTAGVALMKAGTIRNFDLGHAGHEGRLTSACEDAKGNVWLYTADA